MGKMRRFRRAVRSCVNQPLLFNMKNGFGAVAGALLERVADPRERVHDSQIHDVLGGAGHHLPFAETSARYYRMDHGGAEARRSDDPAAMDDDDRDGPMRVSIFAGPTIIPGGAGKSVALVPCRGVAMYDLEWQPLCFSTLLLAQTVTALANDPEIGTIVLDIDSPGGMVTGTAEAGDAIFAARKRKKVVALVNPLAASAAYWIASQASEIIAVKSGDVGSIGVFMAHTDCSKFNEMNGMNVTYIYAGEYKIEGNPDQPLTKDAMEYYQSEVDDIYKDFLKAVARGRSTNAKDVFDNFGKGRCMSAPKAKAIGMIDDYMTIGEAFSRWGVGQVQKPAGRRGEDGTPAPAAEATYSEAGQVVDTSDASKWRHGGTTEGHVWASFAADQTADTFALSSAPTAPEDQSAQCVDEGNLIYRVHEGSVRDVYDSGRILGDAQNPRNYSSREELLRASIAPGHYATCQAEGLFRLGAQPAGDVTLEIDPDGPAAIAAREYAARNAAAAARGRRLALLAAR